ncbi:MFS transporter [Salininema proteolyticum]|uniref:MFS transporter n=1 Tax=Salininema proteolyticum TaxID=1607685 RepID=A0ABV8U534_9ACTN
MPHNFSAPELLRGRTAIFGTFATSGFTAGIWAASLPALDQRMGLGEARLGTVLLSIAAAALVSALITGRLCDRYGSRAVLLFAGPLCAISLVGPTLATDFTGLIAFAIVYGTSQGVLEVSMNVNSVELETAYDRPILSSFHGSWSLGSAAAGGATALAVGLDIGAQAIVLGGIALCLAAHAAFNHRALAFHAKPDPRPSTGQQKTVTRSPLTFLLVGLIAVLACAGHVTEGAIYDWANIFAVQELNATDALAPLSLTVFAAAMTIARFLGDAVRSKLGSERTLVLSGVLSASGYTIALVSPHWGGLPAALAGWTITGLGLSIIVPVLFGAVGAAGGSGRDLALVSTFGGFGLLIGPALIGYLAHATDLATALIIPGVLTIAFLTVGPFALKRLRHIEDARKNDKFSDEPEPAISR